MASATDRAALCHQAINLATNPRLARTRTTDCSDPARSPWIILMALSPPASRNHPLTPPIARSFTPRGSATRAVLLRRPRSSASGLRGPSPRQKAFQRFTTRSGPRLRLRPLRTPGHPDALGIDYRTSTTKAQEGLTPPRHQNCQAYTRNDPAHAPGHRREPSGSGQAGAGSASEQPACGAAEQTAGSTAQTSSMRAIGALSPWRGPSLRMRV